jgi:protein-L-isoaspartate O-methyltransferase
MSESNVAWSEVALTFASKVTKDAPQWHQAVASTPRHVLVPSWWERRPMSAEEWDLIRFAHDDPGWLTAVYTDRTLVTRVGTQHADHAEPKTKGFGEPTSSSTIPSLIVSMLGALEIKPRDQVLDVGTGVGYSAALLSHHLGDQQVTSIDVDPYLVQIARQRLAELGSAPEIVTADATTKWADQFCAEQFDRVLATVSVRPIPSSWIRLLRRGGQLLTTVAGTGLLILFTRDPTGVVRGSVQTNHATFMASRATADYPPKLDEVFATAKHQDGSEVRLSAMRLPDLWQDWQLRNLLELDTPGIEVRTVPAHGAELSKLWLLAADGSWARAEDGAHPIVHQSGSRRLWDCLERVDQMWSKLGRFTLSSLRAEFVEGRCQLAAPNGHWRFSI